MPDTRRLRLDFTAAALLLAGLLVALSVFSYTPADAPGNTVYPPPAVPANVLGPGGAWVAHGLYEALGVAVYALLASWFVLVVLLFLRRGLTTWLLRLVGWLLLVPGAALAGDALGADLVGGPVAGGGGVLGAWLTVWLEANLYPVGRLLIVGSCYLLAVILTGDFVLARLFQVTGPFFQRLARSRTQLGTWLRRRESPPIRNPAPAQATEDEEADDEPGTATPEPELDAEPARGAGLPTAPPRSAAALNVPIRHHDEAASPPALALVSPDTDADDRFADYELPPLTLLDEPQPFPYREQDQRLREQAALLEKTFTDFGLNVRVAGINTGPVVTQYEVTLETGLRVHKVTRLADDVALNLRVPSVRMVAPIPGKNAVGIEVPNEQRAMVRLKEVLHAAGKRVAKMRIPLFLGKDTEGRPLVYDLAEMPHLLIAGRTGTGKSVCMNTIILSMLLTRRPDEVKMIMIDPKQVELIEYGKIPHLMHPIVKDMKKAEAILAWAVDKMEERYDLLSRARVRNLAGYNELGMDEILRRVQPEEEERAHIPEKMHSIVIFVDELADLMMMLKKEVEGHIIRLAQKSRAAGIHLVVATQKPTVDVITGLIKSNLPARICFQVSSRSDSRVVLDEMGADKLLGKGDMLFLQPGTSTLIRAQGAYASDKEISGIVEYLECEPCYAQELVQLGAVGRDGKGGLLESLRARDELYEQAIEIVVREGRGSVSLLQRALGVGYGRAARLIDYMAEDGIVGDYNGSQAREVLYSPQQWDDVKQGERVAP
jgi:S-DNA-T family DNA segregation ATPase FtsK/SpoIIIE